MNRLFRCTTATVDSHPPQHVGIAAHRAFPCAWRLHGAACLVRLRRQPAAAPLPSLTGRRGHRPQHACAVKRHGSQKRLEFRLHKDTCQQSDAGCASQPAWFLCGDRGIGEHSPGQLQHTGCAGIQVTFLASLPGCQVGVVSCRSVGRFERGVGLSCKQVCCLSVVDAGFRAWPVVFAQSPEPVDSAARPALASRLNGRPG